MENGSEEADVNQGSDVLGHRTIEIEGQSDLMLHVPDRKFQCMFKLVQYEFQLNCVSLWYMVRCNLLQM